MDRPVSQSSRDPAFLDLALITASLLPVVLFACLAYYSYRNAIAEVQAAVNSRVELLLGHTTQLIQVNALLLDRLRERFDRLDTRTIAAAEKQHHGYLAGLRKLHPDVLGMSVIARDGRGVAHSHLFPIPPANAADRDYFAAHRDNPGAGLFVSAPLRSRLVAEPGFVLSIRRGDPSNPFDGIYAASIRTGHIFEFWERVARYFGSEETMSLIRADGTILVRFPDAGAGAPAKLGPDSPLSKFIATGREAGTWEGRSTVDAKQRLIASRKIQGLPLYVSYGVTTEAALAPWRREILLMGVVAVAASAALLLLSLLVRRRNRSLREAALRKDEFIAALSHELRNPLAAISHSAELLDRPHLGDDSRRQALAIIARQLGQLRRLVDDLLDTARATYGKLMLAREPVDLVSTARNVVDAHRGQRDMRARITLVGSGVWALADPARVHQMIENLVDNALKYGGTEVRIEAEVQNGWAEISVGDNGEGIAPEMMSRLFQPFMQGEQALDRARGGLGLGLALVNRLATLHGGSIRAASEGSGKGSRFTVRLPLADAPAASVPAPGGEPAPRRRVLIVEDQADARESLKALLRMDGHEVILANDGDQGLEHLRSARPDVALIDIGLPGMDGYELARRARKLPGAASVKLVALSGYALDEDRKASRAAGFDLHLAKPVSYEQLVGALS